VIGMTPGCFARRTEGRKISGSSALRLTEPGAYSVDRKPFPFSCGIWLRSDYETTV
jgi:hypothetical protein